MPIYEYTCKDCGHEFEELVFSLDALPPCPQCGSERTEKLMSACAAKVDGGSPGLGDRPVPGGGCNTGG
ncbi:MAG: zinc ribbon domain-containing protein [Desulfovibrionaceae bacterium]|nr:zinc ribbon domain-containing protein [Desulfovibrionaceae bacterium]